MHPPHIWRLIGKHIDPDVFPSILSMKLRTLDDGPPSDRIDFILLWINIPRRINFASVADDPTNERLFPVLMISTFTKAIKEYYIRM